MIFLSQKDVLKYFRDNEEATELKVYYSFVGNYTINGRRGSSEIGCKFVIWYT